MLTPSFLVPLVQCQCFFLAPITVLVSLGVSVTPSQFPPVSECPPQSLITAITSEKKKSSIYTPPFVNAMTFTETNYL
ncbi:unnamed protein product, partial [Staurois parvus]